jgi:erythromycin esterase
MRQRPALAQHRLRESPVSSAVVQWIAANAIRLHSAEPGNGFADMEPLKQVVGDARIVELGEATHGTHEFFQLKHRMLEFLATEMGFNIFAIEANMPEAYRINEYVRTGRGDPRELLKGMYFWTWNTQEVLDMIVWMREFNKSGKGHVEFTGFDMQTPTVAVQIVRDFVHKLDARYEAGLEDASRRALAAKELTRSPQAAAGTAIATIPISQAAGKNLRYSGYINRRRHQRMGRSLVAGRREIGHDDTRQHEGSRSNRHHGLEAL